MIYTSKILTLLFLFFFFSSLSAQVKNILEDSHEHHHVDAEQKDEKSHVHEERADQVAPAGVMAPHLHKKGSWIFDFRSMTMQMSTLLMGNKPIGGIETLWFPQFDPTIAMPSGSLLTGGSSVPQTSLNDYRYMSVPKSMTMEMYMANVMYGLTDDTMLMFMLPVIKNKMVMETSNFDRSNMSSGGVGDISFTAAHRFFKRENHDFFLNFGVSLPTGSIDETDSMPMMGRQKVPYNMQPGTGTINYLPGFTYTGKSDRFSWGINSSANLRSSKNQNNYRFGNRYETTTWIAYSLFQWMSFSARVQSTQWENLRGRDSSLDPKMDPQNDPNRQGGNRSEAYLGLNFLILDGPFRGTKFGFEAGRPFHQHLNGPQMAVQSTVNLFVRFQLE
ncbi:phenol degradation protein meta [Leptospira tipperaryensis]|uniref:Phenol degradation protein meta n=1 Tax=Leptospira tipperaryensis TaxID=2564040 RepID=A0A1D7V396_9LEPT|nr:transporter [Leptospira tipperaryensis]AOP36283.1 phenol degradation protein meta [Leptospira tipperaryensis]